MVKAIVVGAGIGGISAAARLARMGYQVEVYEKASLPGGRAGVVEQDGYRFDTGPTLFLMPEVWAETYAALGERIEDHLELIRLDPTYRVHFQDGATLDLSSNLTQMRQQLDSLEPGSFEQYLKFIAEGYRFYKTALDRFVGRNFYSIFEFLSLQNLPLIFQLKALTSHAANTASYFKDSRLRAAFSFQNMYLGLSPYAAPATYSLLQYTEMGDGVWFPKGGLYRGIETLVQIAQKSGVRFFYNASVKQIEVVGESVKGIVLESGEKIGADIVVANADLPYVYSHLLPSEPAASRLNNKKYTSSALMFYWGFKGEKSKQLLHHNMFVADQRYKESFTNIFGDLTLPEEPSFYINAPSRTDPSFAPVDGDGLMALVPVGHLDAGKPRDWDALEQRARRVVLNRLQGLGIKDLETRMVFERKWGPPFYEKELNLTRGSAFGLSHNFTQIGYFRPHNRHARYKNLYFVGASTHPGTGLPIVLLSARLVVERILKEGPVPEPNSIRTGKTVLGTV